MSVFKRGNVYWYEFVYDGRRIQRSTKQRNYRAAVEMESAFRTELAKGEVGIKKRKPAPRFRDFAERFLAHMHVHSKKARTLEFWRSCTSALLQFAPLANARLDQIDARLLDDYANQICQRSPATVNRYLATVRRALRLAQQWGEIDRIPKIEMLPGERNREFVLTSRQRAAYLAAVDEPLHSLATFLLETGLRLGEALALTWDHVHLDPVGDGTRGYVHVREGKSRFAKRNVSLTDVARRVLVKQQEVSMSEYVFVREDRRTPLARQTLDAQQARIRKAMGLPPDFVLHSLRHTMLTRLGEAGADAFTIQRIAGHSSVLISQRYVHPTPDSLERAFDKLEKFQTGKTVPTVFPTVPESVPERVM